VSLYHKRAYAQILLGLFLLCSSTSCVKHDSTKQPFQAIASFSGRLLVMNQAHRFQLEIDWLGNHEQGSLRLTHGSTGRIIDVTWRDQTMLWRNRQQTLIFQPLSPQAMWEMGIVLPPWQLAHVFAGKYPASMHSKDQRTWQGSWDKSNLKVVWATNQKRVSIMDMQQGRQVIIIFNTVHHAP